MQPIYYAITTAVTNTSRIDLAVKRTCDSEDSRVVELLLTTIVNISFLLDYGKRISKIMKEFVIQNYLITIT